MVKTLRSSGRLVVLAVIVWMWSVPNSGSAQSAPDESVEDPLGPILLVAENLDGDALRSHLASLLGISVVGLTDPNPHEDIVEITVARIGDQAVIMIRSERRTARHAIQLGAQPVTQLSAFLSTEVQQMDLRGTSSTDSTNAHSGVINPFDRQSFDRVATEIIDPWRSRPPDLETPQGLSQPSPRL